MSEAIHMMYPELLCGIHIEKVIGCLKNNLIVTKVTPWPFCALARPFWVEISLCQQIDFLRPIFIFQL